MFRDTGHWRLGHRVDYVTARHKDSGSRGFKQQGRVHSIGGLMGDAGCTYTIMYIRMGTRELWPGLMIINTPT